MLLITFFALAQKASAIETFTNLDLRGKYDSNVYYEPRSVTDDYALQFYGDATITGGPSLTNNFFFGAGGSSSNYFGEQFQRYFVSAFTGWVYRFSLWSDSQLSIDYFYTDNTGEELDWQTSVGYSLKERLSLRYSPQFRFILNLAAGTVSLPFYRDVEFEKGRNDEYLLGSFTLQWLYSVMRVNLLYSYQIRNSDDKTAQFDAHILNPEFLVNIGYWHLSLSPQFGLYSYPNGYYDYSTFSYSSRESQYFELETILSYYINRFFSVGTAYYYSQVDSTEEVFNYHRHEVSLFFRCNHSF
jgi:hypothetical protein